VYKSSEPPLWATPDTSKAFKKLTDTAQTLNGLKADIEKSRYTAISQALGASRDLREAVGFLTAQSGKATAAAAAKRVFKDLDGIALGVQQKKMDIAASYFAKYEADMTELFR
jgi:hypothetical protein